MPALFLVVWKMTPLQNDPQQHQREAKNLIFRVSCGGKRSPDSESPRREISKSGVASHFGPQKCDFTGRGGGPLPEVLTVSCGMRCFRNERQELCITVVRLRTLHHTPGLHCMTGPKLSSTSITHTSSAFSTISRPAASTTHGDRMADLYESPDGLEYIT